MTCILAVIRALTPVGLINAGRKTGSFIFTRPLTPIGVMLGLFALISLGLIYTSTIDTNPLLASKALFEMSTMAPFFAISWLISMAQRGGKRRLYSWTTELGIVAMAIIGAVSIWVTQTAVIQAFGTLNAIQTAYSKGFYVSTAISETYLFQYLLLNTFIAYLGTGFLALQASMILVTVFATVFHYWVYSPFGHFTWLFGTLPIYSNYALLAVGVSFYVLNLLYVYSNGILEVPMLSHATYDGVWGS